LDSQSNLQPMSAFRCSNSKERRTKSWRKP
jgi:hypothetical protein